MHVRVADGHLGVGDVMGVHNQLVEVFELSRLLSVQGEPSNSAPNYNEIDSGSADSRERAAAPWLVRLTKEHLQGLQEAWDTAANTPVLGAMRALRGGTGSLECRTGAGAQFVGDPHLL